MCVHKDECSYVYKYLRLLKKTQQFKLVDATSPLQHATSLHGNYILNIIAHRFNVAIWPPGNAPF
jgi:hypothetical protein